MSENLDLLGDPIPDGFGGRGRPPHIPTVENRNLVRMLVAFEWDDERVARALRITRPTLRKHYFSELRHRDEAMDQLKAKMMQTTFDRAHAGDASMMRLAMKLFERHELDRLGLKAQHLQHQQAKAPKLGKKEAARLAAQSPGEGTTMGDLIAQRRGLGKPN